MSQLLPHSPADILRQAMVDLALVNDPPSEVWPASTAVEADRPDACVTVYDTAPRMDSRSALDGEQSQHYGIQVRVRATTHALGWGKANSLYNALCKTVNLQEVVLDGTPYVVVGASNFTGVVPLHVSVRTDRRRLFVINCTIVVRPLV